MEIKFINPLAETAWLTFISGHKDSNIFHHPDWLRVLKNQYNYKVSAICLYNEGIIIAGLPFCEVHSLTGKKKFVSLPFSDYCNPLYNSEEDLHTLLNGLINRAEQEKISSLEVNFDLKGFNNFASASDSVVHIFEVKRTEDELMKSFHDSKRRGIKKAMKEDLQVVISKDYDAVKSFFNLHLQTRKLKGIPVQPNSFFREIYNCIITEGNGFVILVKKDNVDIAATMFLHFNSVLTYKYNASDNKYQHLRPNNLIVWHSLLEAIRLGLKYYDFGKSDLDNKGLREFKSQWGGIERENFVSYYPTVPEHGLFGAVKDKIVSPVIRNSPDFVCQLIGEIGYKYFPSI
jgi:CelD/BcsL family acetyltransferase involved in cellulose biosynthesis